MSKPSDTLFHITHAHTDLALAFEHVALPLVSLEHPFPSTVQTKDAFTRA